MGIKRQLFRYYFPELVASAAIRNMPATTGIVLMYHEVLPDSVTLPAWTLVRESDFRWQMSYLQQHFDIVSMDQALERISEKVEGNKPFAVVTFDDGYRGNLNTVLPIMDSMGLPFIVYVATRAIVDNSSYWYDNIIDLLNKRKKIRVRLELDGRVECFRLNPLDNDRHRWREMQRVLTRLKQLEPAEREICVMKITAEHKPEGSVLKMLSSADLQNLAASDLVTIGAHTHGHELLDQLKPQAVHDSLHIANEIITRFTGCAPRHFSYPNGNFNQDLVKQARQAGYKTAVTTMSGYWEKSDPLMEIPRVCVGRFDTKSQFKAGVAGFLRGIKHPAEAVGQVSSTRLDAVTSDSLPGMNASEPINILYIIDNLAYGGTERQLVQLIHNLDRSRFRPHLCTLKASNKLYDELDIPKISLNFSSYTDLSIFSKIHRLHRFIRGNRIQLVQTFFQDPFLLAAIIKPFNKVKLIGSFRDLGFWRTKAESWKMRIAFPFFSGFIANAQAVKEHFIGRDGLRPDKIEVIYNGFDSQQIELSPSSDTPSNGRQIVGIVGNFNREVKRVDDFVKAAALVAEKKPETRFVIVGDGKFRSDLENLAAQLGVLDKIQFTGRVEHPMHFVKDFSVGVITSETEGFCNAIVEYMAYGIPVVATNVGGNPELITEVENGFLVPVGNPTFLANKIVYLLDNESLRTKIGRINKVKIFTEYSVVAMVEAHNSYYQKIFDS